MMTMARSFVSSLIPAAKASSFRTSLTAVWQTAALSGIVTGASARLAAQGCIGPLSSPATILVMGDFQELAVHANQWSATAGFQWFQSKRDFIGDQEVTQRYDQMVNE